MKKISKELEENIVKDYVNNLSTMAITRKYGISRSTTQKYLLLNDIKLHKRTSVRVFNYDFFSEYTKESCYWAGFILADGYIRKDRNTLEICLSDMDSGHLLKFLKAIGVEEDIRRYYPGKCVISISLDKFKEDLEKNFEIHNKKSLNCYISEKIPKEMLKHYVRGYFDGDGTFSNNRFAFVGTYKTIDFIRNYLKDFGIVKTNGEVPKITEKFTKNYLYEVKYSKCFSKKIFNVLFDDCDETIRLDRKYTKIKNFIDCNK